MYGIESPFFDNEKVEVDCGIIYTLQFQKSPRHHIIKHQFFKVHRRRIGINIDVRSTERVLLSQECSTGYDIRWYTTSMAAM